MIYFKTLDEQIEILRSRGMIIPDLGEAKQFLEKNNYYNVINAYKDIFVSGQSPEKYKEGVSFKDFIALWSFDKILRLEFSRFATVIERTLKSKIAYMISQRYGEMDIKYLDINNFNQNKNYLFKSINLIKELNELKQKKIEKQDSMICHCVNKYGCVPMWVFVNIISFGQTLKFYEYINSSVQIEIAKELSLLLKRKLVPKDIIDCGKNVNLMRNLCAHDLRVYDFNPYNHFSANHPVNLHCGTNDIASHLFAFIASVYSLTEAPVFQSLIITLTKEFFKLHNELSPDFVSEVYNKIRFPQNWMSLVHLS